MRGVPETRWSLIARIRDREAAHAWDEFASIYAPAVYRLARAKGLGHDDAEDLVQQVLISVSRALERFQADGARGQFRHWLHKITHNHAINALSRRPPDRAGWDTAARRRLDEVSAPPAEDAALLRLEARRVLFRHAAERVAAEVGPATWDAFRLTAIENRPAAEVAPALGITVGAVYAARGRVMKRLRDRVREWDDEE